MDFGVSQGLTPCVRWHKIWMSIHPLTSYYTEPGCFLTQLWDFYQEVKTIEYTHVLEEPEQDLEFLSQFWHFPHPVFTPTQPCSDAATLTVQLHRTHGEHCVSHACSTLPAQPLQVLNERWWANRAFPLTVTRQELRRHSYHSSSYQGHKSSVGPRECSYHCQLMSSKEASSKASRFIQELFCFYKVQVLFFCFLLFFFFKKQNRSSLHFTLAPSFKVVASENSWSTLTSTGAATLWSHCSRSSWWPPHSFPSWAGCRPSPCPCPCLAALWQEVWSKSCLLLCSLQNPAGAQQQTHGARSRVQHLWDAGAWHRGLEDAPSCRTSLFGKLLYHRKSDCPVFTRIDK